MQDNFNFKAWLQEHRSGPYSKDNAGKKTLNESVEEAMDLTPPSPENIYEPEEEEERGSGFYKNSFYDRVIGLAGLQIKDAIETLRNDGFEDDEIMDAFKMILLDYDDTFSEGEVNEFSHDPDPDREREWMASQPAPLSCVRLYNIDKGKTTEYIKVDLKNAKSKQETNPNGYIEDPDSERAREKDPSKEQKFIPIRYRTTYKDASCDDSKISRGNVGLDTMPKRAI